MAFHASQGELADVNVAVLSDIGSRWYPKTEG